MTAKCNFKNKNRGNEHAQLNIQNDKHIHISAVKPLIVINCIQNKSFFT